MVYSENTPQLESELHKKFWDNRVNFVNYRREFFNVDILKIEESVKENGAEVEFVKTPKTM